MSLRDLVQADKSIAVSVEWTKPSSDDSYSRFNVALAVGEMVDASLTLSGGCYASIPQQHVSLELGYTGAQHGHLIRLVRIDWRSLKGGHSNHRKCKGRWSGQRVPNTHHHAFDDNYVANDDRMRNGKLPCASPLSEEPENFFALRNVAASIFRIDNIELVPSPPWVYDLLSWNGRQDG